MKRKIIKISDIIILDLIYGRLRGPVKSNAPRGMKIVAVNSEMVRDEGNFKLRESIDVIVEHDDFEEVERFAEYPVLEIQFTEEADADVRSLVAGLQEIRKENFEAGAKSASIIEVACHRLETDDARYNHLFEDYCEMRKKNIDLESKLEAVIEAVKNG